MSDASKLTVKLEPVLNFTPEMQEAFNRFNDALKELPKEIKVDLKINNKISEGSSITMKLEDIIVEHVRNHFKASLAEDLERFFRL